MWGKTWLSVSSHASADCFRQTLDFSTWGNNGSDAERAAYQISKGLIHTLLQTSHDRNIKTSHYPQHPHSVQPMNLWIIKNRHIMLQGWKSGGMLQMLLSKTATSGVCFYLLLFLNRIFSQPGGWGVGVGGLEGCMSTRVRRNDGFACVLQDRMEVKGRVSGLVWHGVCWVGWMVGLCLGDFLGEAQLKPAHQATLSPSFSLSPSVSPSPTLSLSPPLPFLSHSLEWRAETLRQAF